MLISDGVKIILLYMIMGIDLFVNSCRILPMSGWILDKHGHES